MLWIMIKVIRFGLCTMEVIRLCDDSGAMEISWLNSDDWAVWDVVAPWLSRERLWVVEGLKGRYRNDQNEWMNVYMGVESRGGPWEVGQTFFLPKKFAFYLPRKKFSDDLSLEKSWFIRQIFWWRFFSHLPLNLSFLPFLISFFVSFHSFKIFYALPGPCTKPCPGQRTPDPSNRPWL